MAKAIHEGNGTGVLFIDAAAHPAQVEGLAKIFSGQAGGMPWEALAATLTTVDGPIVKPIEMTINGRRSRFRIADILDVNLTPMINPVTGAESEVHIVYPKAASSGTMAMCVRQPCASRTVTSTTNTLASGQHTPWQSGRIRHER